MDTLPVWRSNRGGLKIPIGTYLADKSIASQPFLFSDVWTGQTAGGHFWVAGPREHLAQCREWKKGDHSCGDFTPLWWRFRWLYAYMQ